jgi:hypothetical protein
MEEITMTMTIEDLVQKVSEIYRAKRDELSKLTRELLNVKYSIEEAKETYGKNITLGEYNKLIVREQALDTQAALLKSYCDGISCVREMLMDLGFDTEVEVGKKQ